MNTMTAINITYFEPQMASTTVGHWLTDAGLTC